MPGLRNSMTVMTFICMVIVAPLAWGNSRGGSRNTPQTKDLIQYVNPFAGTVGGGNTFPGATVPFGMIQWSPNNGPEHQDGGYNYEGSMIYGFSIDHLSGAGCAYGEDFLFSPVLLRGKLVAPVSNEGFPMPYTHSNEKAEPGYYSVKFDNGISAELTATARTGFGSFTYPVSDAATMIVNASSNIRGSMLSFIHINPGERSVSGAAVVGHFCSKPVSHTIYFYAVFNRPFAKYGTWSDSTVKAGGINGDGQNAGAYLTFSLTGSRTVLAKVAISYVSISNAKKNLEAEDPGNEFTPADFNKVAAEARQTWNNWLNKIQVTGGTNPDLKTFYTMLYHTALGPTICSDVNGQYMGYDGRVHTASKGRMQYANFSGWDIYRSEAQLLGMLTPKRASDMAQSLLRDYQQGGAFPRWGVEGSGSGVMMGDPAAPIIADIYAFGGRSFDVQAAYKGLLRAATDPGVRAKRSNTYERDGLSSYLKLGYVPEYQIGGYGPVSMTLEYTSADFALSRLANALGDTANANMLLAHAQNWKNLYNPETGYIQMKRRDGTWTPGFKPGVGRYDKWTAYVEGTAAQYVWMVPYNLKGLAEAMGGYETAATRLDTFFTKLNVNSNSIYAYLGNEPCLETPWEYNFFGMPYKTQSVVRRAMTELFSYKPDGYPGNDDLGEMSSWYVFAALGMYPELPGSNILVIGSPLFKKTVIHLKGGEVTIEGRNAGDNAQYVHGLSVNGRKWNRSWIRFTDISHGGKLIFDLGTRPDKKWASSSDDVPPSFN